MPKPNPRFSTVKLGRRASARLRQPLVGYDSGPVQITNDPEGVVCGTRYGVNVPQWKQRIRRGEGATTVLEGRRYRIVGDSPVTGRHLIVNSNTAVESYRTVEGDASSFLDLPNGNVGSLLDEADVTARMKFIKHAREAQRALSGLTVLGELRETVHMITRPLKTLRNYVDQLTSTAKKRRKKIGNKNRKRLKDAMADTWLEWSFGAVPLVNDIVDGAEAASRAITFHPPSMVVSGKGRSGGVVSITTASTVGANIQATIRTRKSVSCEVKYYGRISTVVPGHSLTAGTFGVTFNDVIPAAWELIPYSFLVDYFTNVGEVIEAACFPYNTIAWANRGEKVTYSNKLENVDFFFTGGLGSGESIVESSIAVGTGCERLVEEVKRSDAKGIDWVPPLRLNGLNFKEEPKKYLNIAALAATGRLFNGDYRS